LGKTLATKEHQELKGMFSWSCLFSFVFLVFLRGYDFGCFFLLVCL